MRRWFPLVVLFGLAVVAARSLWWQPAPYFFLDDGFLHLFRVFEFDRVLAGGVVYPRWAPDLAYGYGYPIFNYYPPLAYYLTETLHLIGLPIAAAVKGAFGLVFLVGAGGAFVMGRQLFESSQQATTAGLLTAAAYVFFPYFLLDVYTRGAIAEAFAAAILPWLVWSLRQVLVRRSIGAVALMAIFSAILVLSHNLTAFYSAPFLGVYALWELGHLPAADRAKAAVAMIGAITLGAALAAVYWLPLIAEMSLVAVSRESKQLATIIQYSMLGAQDVIQPSFLYQYHEAPFPLAAVPMGVAALAAMFAIVAGRRFRARGTVVFFSVVAVVGTILMTEWTRGIWLGAPFLATLQFPWRLSVLIGLGVAVAIGSLPAVLPQIVRQVHRRVAESGRPIDLATALQARVPIGPVAALVTGAVLVGVGIANLDPIRLDNPVGGITLAQLARFESNSRNVGLGTMDEYLPLTVKFLPQRLDPKPDARPAPNVTIEQYSATRRAFRVSAPDRFALSLHSFYFPDWQVTVDGQPARAGPSTAMGLLTIDVPAGEHQVVFTLGDTWPRQVGGWLSAVGALGLIVLTAMAWRRREQTAAAASIAFVGVMIVFAVPTSLALRSSPPALQPVNADVSLELGLIGIRVEGAQLVSNVWRVDGSPENLDLGGYWQVKQSVPEQPFVWQLVDEAGHVWARRAQLARFGSGLAATWVRDEIVADQYDLPLAGGMPPGKYILQAAFGDGKPVAVGFVELAQGTAPAPPEPMIAHPIDALVGDRVRFLGVDVQPTSRPGSKFPLTLYWRADRDVHEDLTVFLQLLDTNGKLVAQNDGLTADGFFPTTLWPAGRIIADRREIELPATTKPGLYRWVAGLYHSENQERLTVVTTNGPSPDDVIELGALKVPMDARAAAPEQALNVSIGTNIRLIGFDLSGQDAVGKTIANVQNGTPARLTMRTGQSLALSLYWQALARPESDYKVFVHVLDENGSVAAQQDAMPGKNRYPTHIWDANEIVGDPYLLPLDLSPGRYSVTVGMYSPESGERLVTQGDAGQALADRQVTIALVQITGQ